MTHLSTGPGGLALSVTVVLACVVRRPCSAPGGSRLRMQHAWVPRHTPHEHLSNTTLLEPPAGSFQQARCIRR